MDVCGSTWKSVGMNVGSRESRSGWYAANDVGNGRHMYVTRNMEVQGGGYIGRGEEATIMKEDSSPDLGPTAPPADYQRPVSFSLNSGTGTGIAAGVSMVAHRCNVFVDGGAAVDTPAPCSWTRARIRTGSSRHILHLVAVRHVCIPERYAPFMCDCTHSLHLSPSLCPSAASPSVANFVVGTTPPLQGPAALVLLLGTSLTSLTPNTRPLPPGS